MITREQLACRVKFSEADAEQASDEWCCNCGPAALAAVLGRTLGGVRNLIPDFEVKGYTNPTMMWQALYRSGSHWEKGDPKRGWPDFGLARIQWEGPWTEPGVPIAARYQKTHWVGAFGATGDVVIFDINCIDVGGWVPLDAWVEGVVPLILREAVPRANGRWHITHVAEVAA